MCGITTQRIFLMFCTTVLVFLLLMFIYPFRNRGHCLVFSNGIKGQEIFPGSKLLVSTKRRINVVILSLPRSGSSFLGDVFNHRLRVLYFFEPLHSIQGYFTEKSMFHFNFSLISYQALASKFLKDVLTCNFDDGAFTRNLVEKNRHRSLALTSFPFCIKNGKSLVCYKVTSDDLEEACKHNYSVFVMKILTPRIPTGQWSNQPLSSCFSNHESECRIIHLVRDPRAVINSLMTVNFFKRPQLKPRRKLEWFVKNICRQFSSDISFGMLNTISPLVRCTS